MQIIPAIDVLDGQVVRLTEGDYNQRTSYPISFDDMLQRYLASGLSHIHVIDLNGAKGDRSNEAFIYKAIAGKPINIQLGGGIRSVEKIKSLFAAGVSKAIVGTLAVTNPAFLDILAREVSPRQIIIAIDVLDEVIRYNGWLEASPVKLHEFIALCTDKGYARFLCTDISKDGKLGGSSIPLYARLKTLFPSIHLIASGGVSGMADMPGLAATGAESVVVGKAIYEGKITMEEIVEWNNRYQ